MARCYHCGGGEHAGVCPRVRRIWFRADGSVKGVEYHAAAVEPPVAAEAVFASREDARGVAEQTRAMHAAGQARCGKSCLVREPEAGGG